MNRAKAVDIGLLILRVGVGGLMLFHGWGRSPTFSLVRPGLPTRWESASFRPIPPLATMLFAFGYTALAVAGGGHFGLDQLSKKR